MNNIETDERGILITCPKCGRRNRMKYEGLGKPVDVHSDLVFDALISRSALPVLVDFWAPWCGPCKMVAPEIRKVATEAAGQVLVAKVNTEELPSLARRFRVTAIPTMSIFRNGIEVAHQAGAMAAPAIRKFLEQDLAAR